MRELNFKHLYFAVDLQIEDVLTTIGMIIVIFPTSTSSSSSVAPYIVNWAHDCGDLGGEPEGLDCTPLCSYVSMEKAGLQEQDNWTVDYYYNDDDYDRLQGYVDNETPVTINIDFDNGTHFINTGIVRANYLSGVSVNSVADAHAVIELSSSTGWIKTHASSN